MPESPHHLDYAPRGKPQTDLPLWDGVVAWAALLSLLGSLLGAIVWHLIWPVVGGDFLVGM